MVTRRVITAVLLVALVLVACGFDRGGYGGSQWAQRQGGYWARPKGAFDKWYPSTPTPAAVVSGALIFSSPRYNLTAQLTPGCTASVTFRMRDHNTLATIGTNKVTANANPVTVASGWTLTEGQVVDLHYTSDTSTAGFSDVTEWTQILNGWTVIIAGTNF